MTVSRQYIYIIHQSVKLRVEMYRMWGYVRLPGFNGFAYIPKPFHSNLTRDIILSYIYKLKGRLYQ